MSCEKSPRPAILSRKRSMGQLQESPESGPEDLQMTKRKECGRQQRRKCTSMPKRDSDTHDDLEIIMVESATTTATLNEPKVLTVINDGGRANKTMTRSHRASESSFDNQKESEVDSGVFEGSAYDHSGNVSRVSTSSFNKSRSSVGASNQHTRISRSISASNLDLRMGDVLTRKGWANQMGLKLPRIRFADTKEVWELMLKKDEKYIRDPSYMQRHDIKPGMRAILLDWLNEVSEVYHLHRETYYLAIDYIDRFLSVRGGLPKSRLQLLGITCLFIAAKMEEIYPPKMEEFVYVTDNACSLEDVTIYELVVLKALKWELTPVTINHWLGVFTKLYFSINPEENDENCDYSPTLRSQKALKSTVDEFLMPPKPTKFFAKIAHFLDLIVLDVGMLNFSYSHLAASALYHFTNENVVHACTGYKVDDLKECIFWMTPFAIAVRDDNFTGLKFPASPAKKTPSPKKLLLDSPREAMSSSPPPPPSQIKYRHNMQYHTVDLALLEKAHMTQTMFYAEAKIYASSSPEGASSSGDSCPSKSIASDATGFNSTRIDSSILSSPVFKSNFMSTPNSGSKYTIAHPLTRSRSD